MSWRLHFGEGPTKHVLHRCDNRKCVNPEHLFLGTDADNASDKCRKRRQARKLSEPEVLEILTDTSALSLRALARKFGVSKTTIARIRNGAAWRHLEKP